MQTERLYYQDTYLREFTANILDKKKLPDGRHEIVLDRTAFYPEGGGQPCDTGTINDVPVQSVHSRSGGIIHTLAGDPGEGLVTGRLDWQRRFDHMQQHTGEHILSGIFLAAHQAENVGFHLSATTCQIDVTLSSLSPEQACAVEEAANAVIFANRPIDALFVESTDLSAYALRKEPGPEFERIRLVSIQDCDCCPCGGTHVRHTGEVGLLKIRGWEKRKDNIRVEFVCGGRALADYRLKHEIARTMATHFSSPVGGVIPAFERHLERQDSLQHQLAAARKAYHEELSARLLSEAGPGKDFRIVSRVFTGYGAADLQDFAGRITAVAGSICLTAAIDGSGGRSTFLFAAAPDVPIAMDGILKRTLAQFGGKGGGTAATAQGGAVTPDPAAVLVAAQEFLCSSP